MYLKQLKISTFRNLNGASLEFSPQFNWIYGKNGSGKTSFLETIYLLSTGRSFRTRHAEEFIQDGHTSCVTAGSVFSKKGSQTIRLGVERHKTDGLRLRMNEQSCETLSEWVKVLPIQLINVDSYQLLGGPPKPRRQFLDWAMFHVEHSFYMHLQRYRRALKQRNAALRTPSFKNRDAVTHWNIELIEAGESINAMRREFLDTFYPVFEHHLNKLLHLSGKGDGDAQSQRESNQVRESNQAEKLNQSKVSTQERGSKEDQNLESRINISLAFKSGWNEKLSLEEALIASLDRDLALGYTSAGPHRADFSFYLEDDIPVETRLSRGQLKMFTSALFLARSHFVSAARDQDPVCLVDDLCSELDDEATERLLQGLMAQQAQVFITSIEKSVIETFLEKICSNSPLRYKMFHVEHGNINDIL